MKVYVATDGFYSSYHICKIFDSREKAEEYKKYMNLENEIEEYILNKEFEKFITISMWLTYNIKNKTFSFTKNIHNTTERNKRRKYIENDECKKVYCTVSIPANNFNNSSLEKLKKSMYDLFYFIQQKRNEGYSIKDIDNLFARTDTDYIMD